MDRFRVDLIAATPNPQQCVYAAMHQDYSEGFVAGDRANWPDEQRAGEICVKRLLSGERGHYGPMEHAQIVLNVGWFPHSVMQQARTHRVGVSFDVQSMRYTGERICRAADGALDLEEVFYLRPVGEYSDRQGKKYAYTEALRQQDLDLCRSAAERYRDLLKAGFSEEHARGILPFDYRQHFVVSFSLRAFLHFMDLRAKLDAQLEIRQLCDLMWPHMVEWAPEFAAWYEKSRLHRARLAPQFKRDLNLGQRHPFRLVLVLALSIAVGGRAGITLKKQQLTDALIGIDPAVSTGTVAEFKGEVTLPARFSRGGVHDDSKAGIGALAQTDHGDVGGNPQLLQRHTEAVRMRRKNEVAPVFILMKGGGLEVGRVEPLGVHHRARNMPEDQKFLRRQAQVVAVGRATETEHRSQLLLRLKVTDQTALEWLDHSLPGLFSDPAIALEHQKPRRNSVT